jgi:hypothetical protein
LGGKGVLGYIHYEETKKKIGEANKGNPGPWKGKKRSFSDDHCRKIGESHKGKIVIHTKEAKQKMSESHKGLKHSLETKRKIGEKSVGRRAGCILSPEVKNKISIALKGKKRGPYKKRQ